MLKLNWKSILEPLVRHPQNRFHSGSLVDQIVFSPPNTQRIIKVTETKPLGVELTLGEPNIRVCWPKTIFDRRVNCFLPQRASHTSKRMGKEQVVKVWHSYLEYKPMNFCSSCTGCLENQKCLIWKGGDPKDASPSYLQLQNLRKWQLTHWKSCFGVFGIPLSNGSLSAPNIWLYLLRRPWIVLSIGQRDL